MTSECVKFWIVAGGVHLEFTNDEETALRRARRLAMLRPGREHTVVKVVETEIYSTRNEP